MRDRALDPDTAPTADELATMTRLVADASTAGALGFSSSRTLRHRVPDGRYVPGTFAECDELLALATRSGAGRVFEVAPRFDGDGPAEPRVERRARVDGDREPRRRVHAHVQRHADARAGRRTTASPSSSHARRTDRGARIRPQTSPRFIGLLTGLAHRTPVRRAPELAGAAVAPAPATARRARATRSTARS